MSKGLPRSLKRGNPLKKDVIDLAIPLRNATMTIAAAGSGVAFGSLTVQGLPQGNLLFAGAVGYIQLETSDSDVVTGWHGDFGLGVAATADGDLGDVEEDALIPSTTIDAVGSTKASAVVRGTSTTSEQGAIIDNTAGDKSLVLNALIDAADFTDAGSASFTVNGMLYVKFMPFGDD